ncbi:TolB family protein [Sorangium sp. So ce1024]|uniref:TolB family protein n=1 Tax=unclassified Sorangium TaxID=2621164 RepID=UPI003F0EC03F
MRSHVFSARAGSRKAHRGALLLALSTAIAAAAAACSSSDGGGAGAPLDGAQGGGGSSGSGAVEGLVSLRVEPAAASVDLAVGGRAVVELSAIGRFQDGSERDVTDRVTWGADDLFAHVDAGRLTTASPGLVRVTAADGSITARADITVKLVGEVALPGAPPGAGELLDGTPEAASAPAIAYPLDGALFPSNIGSVEVHVRRGSASQRAGRIEITGDFIDLQLVGACEPIPDTDGCAMALPADLVPMLVRASEGEAMETRVRLVAEDGSALGESAAIDVRWAGASLSGGLYYWRTDGTTLQSAAIYRYDLDDAASPPELFWDNEQSPPLANGQEMPCMGCHALAMAGDKMALTFGGSGPSSFALVDVATADIIALRNTDRDGFATMTTFSPDGARMVNAFRGVLTLRRADETLESLGDLFVDEAERLTQPFWSPDGKHLAFVAWRPDENGAGPELYGDTVRGAQILIAGADGAGGFEAPRALVPREQDRSHYYPAISDDGAWVVFNTSRCDGPPGNGPYGNDPCDSYDDNSARLRIVPVEGGEPVDLARANGDDTWANSWPRFGPSHDTYRGKNIYWVAFSSRRPYGLRLPGSNDGTSKPQLWFAAVTLAPGGPIDGDPSFAPVWMPMQNDDMANPTGNHIPQWAEKALPVPQ